MVIEIKTCESGLNSMSDKYVVNESSRHDFSEITTAHTKMETSDPGLTATIAMVRTTPATACPG